MADPAAEYRLFKAEIDAAVGRVLASGRYVLGPEGEALERELAAFTGAKHVVGVNSGTDALHLALVAAGIGPGDEVIVPGFTFFATAEAVSYVGATPVFADIERAHVQSRRAIGARTHHVKDTRAHRRSPVRAVRRAGSASRTLRKARPRARRGLCAGAGRRLRRPRRRDLGPVRLPLVLPDEEPRRRRRRRHDPVRVAAARRDAAHAAPSRQPQALRARAASAGTAGSTSCRRRSCA